MADYEDYEPEDEGYERESPEVYRRRRIMAIIVAIVVIILLIWGVTAIVKKVSSSMGGDDAGAAASTSAEDNFDSFSARPDPSDSGSYGADTSSPSDSASAQPSDSASAQPSASASSSTPTAMAEGAKPSATPTASPTTQQPVQACSDSLQVTTTTNQASYGAGQNPQITAHLVNTSQNPCTVDLGAQKTQYTITSGPAHVYSSATCGAQQGGQLTLQPGKEQTTSLTWDRGMNVYGCGAAAQQARTGVYHITATVNGVSSQPVRIVIQ